jgi:hypothetical protein
MTAFYTGINWLYAGVGKYLRVAGTSTVLTNVFAIPVDSTATVALSITDTCYSDTFKFEDNSGFFDYKYLHVMLIRDSIVTDTGAGLQFNSTYICDSCDDSVVVATTVWTRDKNGYDYQLASDVPAADKTNDTASLRFYINGDGQVPHPDSTVRDWLWIRTIITDSIMTPGEIQNPDIAETLYYRARYYLWFSE